MGNEIFKVFPEINTERLNLREIKQEDAESIYIILSNPEGRVTKKIGAGADKE